MYTLEEKIDIILQYITTDDSIDRARLKRVAAKALKESSNISSPVTNPKPVDIETVIEDLLTEMGIPDHLMGYRYSMVAIKLIIENPSRINYMTKELYPLVAEHVNSTHTKVERAIRHGVEVAWDNRYDSNMTKLFGNTVNANKGKPTNAHFLAVCVKEVNRRMKKIS